MSANRIKVNIRSQVCSNESWNKKASMNKTLTEQTAIKRSCQKDRDVE